MSFKSQGTFFDHSACAFLHDVERLIDTYLSHDGHQMSNNDDRVVNFVSPEELKKILHVPIENDGLTHENLLSICEKMLRYSVNTHHSRFFNQLYTGPDLFGLAGEYIVDAINSNPHIYLVSPCLIMSETFVIDELGKILSYENMDGIFVPGASMGNILAMHAARYKLCDAIKVNGLFRHPILKVFASLDVHYSVIKAASLLGIGTANVIYIQTDDNGRMKANDLENKIIQCKQEGSVPLIVIATCGTTVLGAFDPLEQLSSVCTRHNIWLHADASWGGPVIFSKSHRHLLHGISKTNSAVVTFHKLLGAPIQCSVLLTQGDKTLLAKCNSENANYLFADNCLYDTQYELGNKTVQCGRKADGFKAWLMWLARGHNGMEQRVDRMFQLTSYFRDQLAKRKEFLLVCESEYVNVPFWFIPPSMQERERNDSWWQQLGQVTERIKKNMTLSGDVMINCQSLPNKGYVTFFRLIVANPATTENDLNFLLDEIKRLGNA